MDSSSTVNHNLIIRKFIYHESQQSKPNKNYDKEWKKWKALFKKACLSLRWMK